MRKDGREMLQPAKERRQTARRYEETLVRFEGENFSIYSRATDISDRGAFVATHYLLDPGTQISLHVIDSKGLELKTSARVVRSIGNAEEEGDDAIVGLGVEFVS